LIDIGAAEADEWEHQRNSSLHRFPPNIGKLSYGELAAHICPPLWSVVVKELADIKDNIEPDDPEVERSRDSVRDMRNCLDLFSFAYPRSFSSAKHSGHSHDAFEEVRAGCNVGYTEIGNFRNLIFVHPDKLSVKKLRNKVLDWRKLFDDDSKKHDYGRYVSKPSSSDLFRRPENDLSPYFWGACNVEPTEKLSGVENIAALLGCLFDAADHHYAEMYKDVHEVPLMASKQTYVHDYRKTIRGILAVSEFFPVVYTDNDSKEVKDALQIMLDAYNAFGDLEDKIAAYQYYVSHGSKKEREKAEQALKDQSDRLYDWLHTDAELLDWVAKLKSKLV